MLVGFAIAAFAIALMLKYVVPHIAKVINSVLPASLTNNEWVALWLTGFVVLLGLIATRWALREAHLHKEASHI